MNAKYDTPLKGNQIPNPVLYTQHVPLPEGCWVPTKEDMRNVFGGDGKYIKTVGSRGSSMEGAHYLAVQKGVSLHTDPGFPRYTHQLVVHSDGYNVHGKNKVGTPLIRGTFFLMDTHSPHALGEIEGGTHMWYVAASIDNKKPQSPEAMITKLVKFLIEARPE